MIDRLVHALQRLAVPGGAPATSSGDNATHPLEVARDFADAYMLVADCPQLSLSAFQCDALERVSDHLTAMTGPDVSGLWSEAAIRVAPEWETLRRLSREALRELNVPTAPES